MFDEKRLNLKSEFCDLKASFVTQRKIHLYMPILEDS